MKIDYARWGIVVGAVGAVVAVWGLLRKQNYNATPVSTIDAGGNGVPSATPVNRRFDFGGAGDNNIYAPYLNVNMPPAGLDWTKLLAKGLVPTKGGKVGGKVGGKDGYGTASSDDCSCHAETQQCCPTGDDALKMPDGTVSLAPDASAQLRGIYGDPKQRATIGKTANQLKDSPQYPVNQSTGVWPFFPEMNNDEGEMAY